MNNTIRSIGIFRALQLGDLLVAVPALRAIRHRFPLAEISLIGLPWADAFSRQFSCYIDRFVEFPGYPGIRELPVDPARTQAFIKQQRAYKYDMLIQMHGSGKTSNPFVTSLGARITVGHYVEEDGPPRDLTLAAPYPETLSEIQRNLGLVALLGCDVSDTSLAFPLSAQDWQEAETLLAPILDTSRLCIGIHPGARPPSRRWPASYFAFVADTLAERYQAHIVFTGSPSDQPLIQEVIAYMKTPVHNLAGKTSLGGLAAVLKHLHLFLSNDTGPAHLASAVRCPSITLFGPADFQRWAPLDDPVRVALRRPVACSPCSFFECPIDHRCLRWLSPSLVLRTAQDMLRHSIPANDLSQVYKKYNVELLKRN
ncbi:glycosyltransferase family 9 protein [Dictyobacter aurantiacus]|uniref:LPS biosynthesis-related glycosyltransferase n=1 Tax=Dictyobacter aurantiacus TaxID=1936993 RepID=A0A401Z7B9_9CHLR|nr:glycosyltransferase family 9 protein [Dictyobacter aurantiacus]GCE02752.1 LPS biosynthesis-related glycosyltransferase [Dictyobacter aurantiacus]